MDSAAQIRGKFRRILLAHTIMWVIFPIVLLLIFPKVPSWKFLLILLMAFIPPFMALPGFIRFRHITKAMGYTYGTTIRQYLLGVPAHDLQRVIDARQLRESQWERLFTAAQQYEPQLIRTLKYWQLRDNLEEAQAVFHRATQQREVEANRHQAEATSLAAKAETLLCRQAVEAMLQAGNFKAVERALDRCSRLLERAARLGVRDEVIQRIANHTEIDFASIEIFLKSVETKRSITKLQQDFEARIAAAPSSKRAQLREQLDRLVQLDYGSRDFRKAEYEFRMALEASDGPD